MVLFLFISVVIILILIAIMGKVMQEKRQRPDNRDIGFTYTFDGGNCFSGDSGGCDGGSGD
jgi:hypothetical protein